MERYTEKIDGLWTVLCEYGDPPYPVVTQDVIDLLAAYEDTGLSPEEIIELKGQNGGTGRDGCCSIHQRAEQSV